MGPIWLNLPIFECVWIAIIHGSISRVFPLFFFFFLFFSAATIDLVTVWIAMKPASAFLLYVFHFFFFQSTIVDFVNCKQYICALFTVPQITFFSNFFIKNGFHSTIYTFKNYFTTVFLVSVFSFNKNKLNPNTSLVFCEQYICALFMGPQIPLFSNFFIKNGSHGTIYTFKNYFAIIISVINFQFQQNKFYPDPYLPDHYDRRKQINRNRLHVENML